MAELGAGFEDRDSGYFATLPTPPGLLGGLALLEEAIAFARANPLGTEILSGIESLIGTVDRQVTRITTETVKVADEAIRDKIERTRVRPRISSFGFMVPKKSLSEGVRSEVLGPGAVGIGSLGEMDTVVGTDGRPYWRTQEYGSDHNVGRIIYGLFQPGGAAPSQEDFRKHPVFQPGAEGGGAMIIRRPIPARHFMRDGAGVAESFRARELGQLEDQAIGEIRVLRAALPAAA